MKIEIGKEYITRSGLKVKIYDIAEAGDYPVIAGVFEGYNIHATKFSTCGRYNLTSKSGYDIISEWQEPLDFDWSCLPAWVNEYIAMDQAGLWYGYSEIPEKITNQLIWKNTVEAILIPKEYAPKNFKGTWDKSLFKNPNIPCEK